MIILLIVIAACCLFIALTVGVLWLSALAGLIVDFVIWASKWVWKLTVVVLMAFRWVCFRIWAAAEWAYLRLRARWHARKLRKVAREMANTVHVPPSRRDADWL
jgi:hypothetical protein